MPYSTFMNASSINILIANSDEEDSLMFAEALKDNLPSAKIVHVTDGIAALRYLKTHVQPDLVFLDLNMPFKNGINCLKDIYNLSLLPATPVIVSSTTKNMKDIKAAYEYGAAFYIIKPASFIELNEIIKRAISTLGKPRGERVDKSGFVLKEANSYSYI